MASFAEGVKMAREQQDSERKGLMDMITWRQMGEMRNQQMRLAEEDQRAKRQVNFLKEIESLRGIFKEADPAKREYMIKQTARRYQMDPNSPFVKDAIKLYKSADDSTLRRADQTAAAIGAYAPDPETGQATLKAYMAGQIDDKKLGETITGWSEQKRRQRTMEGKPSVADTLGLPGGMRTGRVAGPQLAQGAAEMALGTAVPSATGPGQDASMAFAPQARGGVKGSTGMDVAPGAPKGANPLEVATKAKNTVDSVFGPDGASRMMLDPTSAGSMGQMMASPQPGGELDAVLPKIAKRESGGRATARAPTSSATGIYQYTAGTWRDSVKKHKPDWAEGLSSDEIDQMRLNPQAQEEIMRKDTARNLALLENNGYTPSGGNLYALHHLGPAGAGRVLQADPSAKLVDVLPKGVIRANPYMREHTAGSLLRSFEIEFGSQPLTPDSAVQAVKTTADEGTAAQRASLGQQPASQDLPTPVQTETIDPRSGQAVADVSQYRDTASGSDRLAGLVRLRDQELQAGNKDLVNALNKTIEDETKKGQRDRRVGAAGPIASEALRLPEKFGQAAFERSIGPETADTGQSMVSGSILGTGGSFDLGALNRFMHRAGRNIVASLRGGASADEVQDTIKAQQDRFLTAMRPAIRIEGEGSQSDAELRQLESSVGKWGTARTVDQYNRYVNESLDFAEQLTGMKFDRSQFSGRKPTDPATAEDTQTGVERAGQAVADTAASAQGAVGATMETVAEKLDKLLELLTANQLGTQYQR